MKHRVGCVECGQQRDFRGPLAGLRATAWLNRHPSVCVAESMLGWGEWRDFDEQYYTEYETWVEDQAQHDQDRGVDG